VKKNLQKSKKKIKYFDLFAGVGGFSLGIKKANTDYNFECVGFSEIDKFCSQVLKHRFPKVKNYGDVQKIDIDKLPDFDILVFGSPCQNLSRGGKQEGIFASRSGLFFNGTEIISRKKPKYFIWENVEGALQSNHGQDFAIVQNTLAETGYTISWQLCNSSIFKSPLQRSRIFITGCIGKESKPKILPITKDDRSLESSCSPSLPVFTASDFKGPTKQRAKIVTKDEKGIRAFTPKERERMMSWPDDWTKYGKNDKNEVVEISKTQRIKMTGNGVCAKSVQYVVESLLSV